MPAGRKKIFPWVLGVAALAGILIALRAHRSSNLPAGHTPGEASSGVVITSGLPPGDSRLSTVPVSSAASTQASSEPVIAAAPQPQKSATPFVLGSPEAPPPMDPTTVV